MLYPGKTFLYPGPHSTVLDPLVGEGRTRTDNLGLYRGRRTLVSTLGVLGVLPFDFAVLQRLLDRVRLPTVFSSRLLDGVEGQLDPVFGLTTSAAVPTCPVECFIPLLPMCARMWEKKMIAPCLL